MSNLTREKMNRFQTQDISEHEEMLKNQKLNLLESKSKLNNNIASLHSSAASLKKNITSFKNINKQISEFSKENDYVKEKPDYSENLNKFENIFQINSNSFEKMSYKIEKLILIFENLKKDIKEAILIIDDFFKYKEEQIEILIQNLNNSYNSSLFEGSKAEYFVNIKKLITNIDFFLKSTQIQIESFMEETMEVFKINFKEVYSEWKNFEEKNSLKEKIEQNDVF